MRKILPTCAAVLMALVACTTSTDPMARTLEDPDYVACVEATDTDPEALAAADGDELQTLMGEPVVPACTIRATDNATMAAILSLMFDPVP